MTKMYVTEYQALGMTPGGDRGQIPMEPPITTQIVDYNAGAATSAAFNAKTQLVRIHVDSICSFLFSTAGTSAATTDSRMVAGQTEYHAVERGGGYKVSAITNT